MVQDIRTLGLPVLVSFHTVARLGGITAAASHLGMAKSGVSRNLSLLEEHLGVRLLERGARPVKLTPIGETLAQRIGSILAEIDLLEEIVREESSGISGPVTLATTPEFAGVLASVLFPEARKRHPNLTFVMRPNYDFEDMQDPGTDLAFRIGSVVDDRLVARQLGDMELCLVGTPALVKRHLLTGPEDLQNAPCLAFQGVQPTTVWTFLKAGETKQVEIQGQIAVRSFSVLYDLALAGHGFAFLPKFMLREVLESGQLIHCLPDYRSRRYKVFLTFRPGARRIARLNAALDLAEELLPPWLSDQLGADPEGSSEPPDGPVR
ncbi:MAG: LysR family transcriptional regulator [Rhodospirillaceae bacterium]